MRERFENFIAGEWVRGSQYKANINPSCTSDVIGEYAHATIEQAQTAINAAREAFPQWSRWNVQRRFDALDFVGAELLKRQQELGKLLAREEGKTLREGVAEVVRAGQIFKYFAGEIVRTGGECLPSVRPEVRVEVTREPIGVVALITPWNFPMAIPAWKIAPALAFGNCVLFKPAELVPGCAWALTEILSRAGLPSGAFNLINGTGRIVGDAIVQSPELDAISFTGSTSVGKQILGRAAQRSARVQLEMGGKNALVVLDDADLDVAVECAIQGAFFSAGQRCTASSRLIVTEKVHDRFVARITSHMERLVIGDALDDRSDIGPVASEAQLHQVERYTTLATAEGGELIERGELAARSSGYYLRPRLVVNTHATMAVNCEEVFGPLASVIRVRDYEEALVVTNNTPFGLSAGICTRSLKHAEHFKRSAEAGMVMVNLPTAGVDYHVPFGGRKASSFGPREQGHYAQEFFTTVKTSYVKAG